MNLADIRKKAQESRILQSVAAEVAPPAPAADQDIELMDYFVSNEDEAPLDNLPDEDYYADYCTAEPEQGPETCSLMSRQLQSDSAAVSTADEASPASAEPHQQASAPVQVAIAGYNPLETILAGRESAHGTDEDSVLQTSLYSFDDVEEYLCFRVAHEEYAISIMAIKEIIKPREITEVPRMPLFISGVISLRGVVIPVMDMRIRLSMPVSPLTGRERIVVLKRGSGFCGVFVDEVIQVARVKKSDIEAPPAVLDGIDREFVAGLGRFDNRMLILLCLETVIDIGVH